MRSSRTVVACTVFLGGCSVAEAATYTDLASYGVGAVTVRRSTSPATKDQPTTLESLRLDLEHESEQVGDCPGLDMRAVSATASGVPLHASNTGGRRVFLGRTRCFSASLTFLPGASGWPPSPDGTKNGHVVLFDGSKRIELDVDRLLVPLAFAPRPSELTALRRGAPVTLRIPGFGGADIDADETRFIMWSDDPEVGSKSQRLPHRVADDAWIVDVPSDIEKGARYLLRASALVRLSVTRCEGVPACKTGSTTVAAEYTVVIE